MRTTFPIRLTSSGTIKRLGLSLRLDPAALSYPMDGSEVVRLGPGVSGVLHAAFNGSEIGIYLENASIPGGPVNVFTVDLDIAPGVSGLSHVALQGSPQPFEAYSSTARLQLDSNGGGLVDLATGVSQAATVAASGEAPPPPPPYGDPNAHGLPDPPITYPPVVAPAPQLPPIVATLPRELPPAPWQATQVAMRSFRASGTMTACGERLRTTTGTG